MAKEVPIIGETKLPTGLTKHNPVSSVTHAYKTLRDSLDCNVPKESQEINKLIDKVIVKVDDPNDEEVERLSRGIGVVFLADKFCYKAKKQRTVVKFDDDESLKEFTEAIVVESQKIRDLQNDLVAANELLHDLVKDRWDTAVKKYGLNLEQRLYWIDEENGTIELIDLDCNSCKGSVKIRKVRQELTERLKKND